MCRCSVKGKIRASFGFCACLCFLAWLDGRWTVRLLVCMAVHELGHWVALRLCRVPVEGFWLSLSGAVLQTGMMDYTAELRSAAAGPAAGFFLGLALLRHDPETALLSFGLTVANLLPLYPMDGGRMLADLLLRRLPLSATEKILSRVSFCTCGILMVLACWGTAVLQMGLWPIFAALGLLCRMGNWEKQLLFLTKQDRIS